MHYLEIKDYFSQQVFPAHPNEWEFEDVLRDIEALEEEQQFTLLQAVPTVWPISQNLCHSVLEAAVRCAEGLTRPKMAEWLRQTLFHYETGGLIGARTFMAQADLSAVSAERKETAVALIDQLARLTPYARGISGFDLSLQQSDQIYTDTETIYLPEKIDLFPDSDSNMLFYKLIIALQCGFVCLGTLGRHLFHRQPDQPISCGSNAPDNEIFLEKYEDLQLARDIYQLAELGRTVTFLKNEFPGLLRRSTPLIARLLKARQDSRHEKNSLMERCLCSVLLDRPVDSNINFFPATAGQTVDCVDGLYRLVDQMSGGYEPFCFLPFMDRFSLDESKLVFERRIADNKKKFETLLSGLLFDQKTNIDDAEGAHSISESFDSARIQLNSGETEDSSNERSQQLVIDNKSIQLPDDLLELINAIQNDLGSVPSSYVSAAAGISGGGRNRAEGERQECVQADEQCSQYDEWDYRRQGYRKNWCSLRERELLGVQSDFVPRTLKKYRGQLKKIKRQFELMYTQERFARRRRSGDDIDLDALIDSLGDQCAGLPPSENLFIQLIRDQRSITTLFLVDMSNSTEGWVGNSIKEALLLLCEALEMVGDEYGIYGFSGMRRMRSEIYTIKEITDRYDDAVKSRLAAIGPKEYTRMGPPIRHMINHFRKVDARTRLLVILSDGKPEDYDDYKSEYAIEDTRKALAEAKGEGIQPYCITIDKEAHDYLEHLFGRGNYAFVPEVELLPSRLTEIYRLLTR